MSSSLSKSLGLSSSLGEELMVTSKKQGIVSILDCERTKSPSLRRTLSADMSSQKWITEHGLANSLKKIASSEEFQVLNTIISDSSYEDEYDQEIHKDNEHEQENQGQSQFNIWTPIKEEKKKKELEKTRTLDMWTSIFSQKAQDETKNLPTYIHPLVKRSASSLSEKSLEICTESLGSETGSDGFSSYPPSETGDAEEEKEEEQQEVMSQKYDMEDSQVVTYNLAAATKKSPPRSFPPPIPSLSRCDGAAVHMKSHRDNGRLVLEAVSVSSQKNFHVQRQDGRLVLTFANKENERSKSEEEVDEMEQFEVELESCEDVEKKSGEDEEEEETEKEVEVEVEDGEDDRGGGGGGSEEVRFVTEQAPKLSGGVINVHRLAIMMNKPMVLANRNPTWPNKFNEMESITPLTQSLPPRPPVVARMISSQPPAAMATTATAAASFNAYEYYWKPKPMVAAAAAATTTTTATATIVLDPIAQKESKNNEFIVSKNLMAKENQELVVLRGNNGDYIVPLLKGCKEPRRTLLFLEPYCIATS